MAELIDKGALYEKMKERYMDRYAGTVRACGFIVAMDMVKDYPATTEAEIRAKAIDELRNKVISHLSDWKLSETDWDILFAIDDAIIAVEEIAEQLKGE